MSLNTRPRSPPPLIWGVRIGHNGGPWHDGPPQRARPRTEEEEEGQGGRRTPPRKEEPREKAPLRRSDGSVAPQPPERALGCCRRSRVCASSPRRWLPGFARRWEGVKILEPCSTLLWRSAAQGGLHYGMYT